MRDKKRSTNSKSLTNDRHRRNNEVQRESLGLEGPHMRKKVKGIAGDVHGRRWRVTT